MTRERLAFIDWLKAIGISLVVYGHLVGWTINRFFPPIMPKQLGVALFVFVAGYSLASETRSAGVVLARRLFEILFLGLLFAVLIAAIGAVTGSGLDLSNFMPFAFGANVLRNNFPANPTTWYIGMYIHLLVVWALVLRRVTVTPAVLVTALGLEIAIRAVVWRYGGGYQSYQLVTNWIGCFLLGRAAGQAAMRGPDARATVAPIGWAIVALAAVWLAVQGLVGVPLDMYAPFRPVTGGTSAPMRLLLSVAVSLLYLGTCWALFHLSSRWRRSAVAEFLSRHTLVIFIAHMPVMFALDKRIGGYSLEVQSALRLVVCVGLVALASVVFHRVVDMAALRERLLKRWAPTAA